MKYIFGVLILAIGFVSCEGTENNVQEPQTNDLDSLEMEVSDTYEIPSFDNEIEFAKYVIDKFNKFEFEALAPFINDDVGVLFSPYAHIVKETAPIYDNHMLVDGFEEEVYWGVQDGSGDPLYYTLRYFIERHISSLDINSDLTEINIFTDKPKNYGSELHNVHEIFEGDTYVEFYHPPSEEGYLDWKGLIVVVSKNGDKYQLKAIIHNQWTI